MAHSPLVGLCPECGAGWTGSPCSTCHYEAPVPVDFEGRPFEPSPAPRDEAREPTTEYIVSLHGNPLWEAIWSAIKPWDIERESGLGYAHATGTDATRIYEAIVAAAPRADPTSEAAMWEAAAKECDDGAVGPGVMFEWEGTLYALGKNGVAALKVMAVGFRANAAAARAPGRAE